MDEDAELADRFEANRARLRAVAYHTLGSPSEADDAVQEAWLRLSRSDSSNIENLGGWLTTVVARVCLDMLKSRREEPAGIHLPESAGNDSGGINPEQEALLADSIGPALLVILHTLPPAERLAFVLHDIFAVPFGDIAAIVGRSPAAARQLASLSALIDGAAGMVTAAYGRPITLTVFTVNGEKIAAIDIIDNPDDVAAADLAILERLGDERASTRS